MLVSPKTRQKMVKALHNAMCGDFCAEEGCTKCEDARLDALLPLAGTFYREMVVAKGKKAAVLVKDKLLHPDAVKVLKELLKEIDNDEGTTG